MKGIEEILTKKLTNELSDQEQQALDVWLQDSCNKDLFDDFYKTWKLSGNINFKAQNHDVNKEWDFFRNNNALPGKDDEKNEPKIINLTTRAKNPKITNRIIYFLAAACVACLIGFFAINQLQTNVITIETANETKEITLPDYSTIILNKNSEIKYHADFNIKHRQISLSGEAYFKVNKGSHSFTVNCGDITTTVIGTEFNLKEDTKASKVILFVNEGIVSFATKQKDTVKATAMQQVTYDTKEFKVIRKSVKDKNSTAWISKKIEFDNKPLCEVIKDLSNYYNTEIQCIAPDTIYFTGEFENIELEEILKIICTVTKTTFQKEQNKIIVE
ncbi:MAG: FecR family protein [Bacteroidales bacterium]|nr:FecR family protein [Bacteroidales bacterium]